MQLPDLSAESLTKLFHADVYGFPLFSLLMFAAAGACGGAILWRRGMRVQKSIVASSVSGLQTAAEYAGGDGKYTLGDLAEENEPPPRLDGDADLETRLIDALAQAPWRVKEGSEIALAKNESTKKWGIATNKITFVLSGNEETATLPAEPEPPLPEAQEEAE